MEQAMAGARRIGWRVWAWGGAAALVAASPIATALTASVNWGPGDVALFAALLIAALLGFEVAQRRPGGLAHRAGVALTLATAVLLVWATLALGFVGAEGHPADLLVAAPIAVALGGLALTRVRPEGAAAALLAAAAVQAAIGIIAVAAGSGAPLLPTVFFVALWLASAGLLRRGRREEEAAGKVRNG